MSGIFGTNAVLITDLTLLIQIISFVFLLVSLMYKSKGKFKIHGSMMVIALILHFVNFLAAMAPSFIEGFNFITSGTMNIGVQTLWIHATSGALSLVLGFFLVLTWIPKMSDVKPCFKRKKIMDVTILFWAISLVFGIATYTAFYI